MFPNQQQPNPQQQQQEQNILQTAVCAHEFVRVYYSLLQSRVDELVKMYAQQAYLNWNGDLISGQQNIAEHLTSLTPGKYEIFTYDSQPVGGVNSNNVVMFIVTGNVKYNDNENLVRDFYHQFILQLTNIQINNQQTQKWVIISENFRLLR